MINWKVVLGSAGFGLILSLLTGAISGVAFGALLLRGLLWFVLFAMLGGGVSYLVTKYLPELAGVLPAKSDRKSDGSEGVDIVLPDENPHVTEINEEDDEVEDALDDNGTEYSRTEEPAARVSTSLAEEVEELEPRGDARRARMDPEEDDEAEDVESAEELPDLSDDETLFSGRTQRSGGAGLDDISGSSNRGSNIDVMGSDVDSEEVAKAIRTVLKRDQKG